MAYAMLVGVGLFILLMYAGFLWAGVAGLGLGIAFAVGAVLVLKSLTKSPLFDTPPLNILEFADEIPILKSFGTGLLILAVVGLYAGYTMALVNAFQSTPSTASSSGTLAPITASVISTASSGGIPMPIDDTACSASVDPAIRGKASTYLLTAENQEAKNPSSSQVAVPIWMYVNKQRVQTNTGLTASGTSITTLSVGDVVTVYGGNSTVASGYYVEPVQVCINKEAGAIVLKAHIWQTEANMAITGLDNNGNALTAGVANSADYNATFGADQTAKQIYTIQNNGATAMYYFNGVLTFANGNMDSMKPLRDDAASKVLGATGGSKYSEGVVGKWAKNSRIMLSQDTGGPANITGWESYYARDVPIMLHEWNYFDLHFEVKSGSTNPAGVSNSTSSDVAGFLITDRSGGVNDAGNWFEDYYTHDSNQNNMGVPETADSPLGAQTGVILQAR